MRLFYRQHGAVSVFLVIILVPVILVCSIFVDVSRVKLARAQVSAAGDLAMNTLLSQYDTQLNDFYGLMASSQSIEEFYDNVEDYFTMTLTSQGISTDDASSYASSITGILSGETNTADFLQISLADEAGVTVSALDNGNLANPAMVKNQIVEFMKFRAPINTASELLGILNDTSEELEKSEHNTKLIEERQEYYEAESDVMEDAKDLYEKLVEYEALGITEEYVNNMKTDINTYEQTYRELHTRLVKDLYNTQGYGVFQAGTINTGQSDGTYSEDSPASKAQVTNLLSKTAKALSDFIGAGKALEEDYKTISRDGKYDIQYWVQLAEVLGKSNSYTNFVNKGNELYSYYAKLKNAYANAAEGVTGEKYVFPGYENVSREGEHAISSQYSWLSSSIGSYFGAYTGSDSAYSVISSELPQISSNAIANGTTNTASANTTINEIYTRINDYYETAKEARKLIDDMQDILEDLKDHIEVCEEKYQDWKTDVDAWKTDDGDTGNLANVDSDDIYGSEGVTESLEKLHEKVNPDTIAVLSERLNAVDGMLEYIELGLTEYEYNGNLICQISCYDVFKACSGVKKENIVVNEAVLNSYAQSSFQFTNSTTINGLAITNGNNPALTVNEPVLYNWVMEKFKDYDGTVSNSAKKQYEDMKKETGKQTEEVKEAEDNGSDNEIKDCENLPSGEEAAEDTGSAGEAIDSMEDDLSGTSSVVTGLFSNFGDKLRGAATTLRDDLYTVDYITSMFTYDTMEKEAAKEAENGEDKDSDEITFSGTTLTNKDLNSDNNWSYLNEVEYIMYGNSNDANKAAAYGTIFLIRFALNLPADYQYYMKKSADNGYLVVNGVATTIQMATWGIIPAGLAQLAIVLALTVAESISDLNSLKDGEKVLLLKDKDDLVVSFNELELSGNNKLEITKGDASSDDDSKIRLAYSDYLKVLLFLNLLSDTKADAIYKRTADVIQVNMQQKQDGFLMKNANVYFEIETDIEVSPLMLSWSLLANEPGNPYADVSWRSFHYETIRGY